MKTLKSFLIVGVTTLFLTSCMTTSFYQVYKTTPSDNIVVKSNSLVYEDENCAVSYNLWEDCGDIGFLFYNKSDENIYLILDESYFIHNGIAYDYYRNRVFTSSKSSGSEIERSGTASKSVTGVNYFDLLQTNKVQATKSVNIVASSGYSVSYSEERVVCIPAKTSKIISEYNINSSLFRDCDLFRYPKKNQIRSKSFSKEESPIVFSNRIAYTIGQSDDLIQFENEFYVTEISNYPRGEMFESRYDEYCGQKSMSMTEYFKDASADKFYIQYNKKQEVWKH